jgi:hypothetical protein
MVRTVKGIFGNGASGLIGLGRSTGNTSYVSEILRAKGWKSVVFGFALNGYNGSSDTPIIAQSAGSFTVRELNPAMFTGEVYWQPLAQATDVPKSTPTDWAINFDSYQISLGSQVHIYGSGGVAIIEPYFQEIRLPTNEATGYLFVYTCGIRSYADYTLTVNSTPGTKMVNDTVSLSWLVPCDQELSLSVTIGSTSYQMKKEQLISIDSTGAVCTSLVKGWANPVVRSYLFGAPFAVSAYIAYTAQRNASD